jgi:hypothetical protein
MARSLTAAGVHSAREQEHTGAVSSWGSFSYLFGPLMAFVVVGALILVLRWTFPGGSRSLVARTARRGGPEDYGLLVPVAAPSTYVQGELLRRSLEDAGIRATLVQTDDGPRVMVWPENESLARQLLAKPS